MLIRNTFRLIVLSFFIVFGTPSLRAQKDAAKILDNARKDFDKGDFNSAIGLYNKLIQLDSSNVEYTYELAQSYYFSDSLKLKSIPYFEFTLNHSRDSLPELYY